MIQQVPAVLISVQIRIFVSSSRAARVTEGCNDRPRARDILSPLHRVAAHNVDGTVVWVHPRRGIVAACPRKHQEDQLTTNVNERKQVLVPDRVTQTCLYTRLKVRLTG